MKDFIMGNEQSSELSADRREAEAQERTRIRAAVIADLDRRKEEAKKRIAERRRQEVIAREEVTSK